MKIIILGPPGAGKGTQAEFIAAKFNIPKISTGDMLREAIANGSDLGLQAKSIMDKGGYVSDELIMQLVIARLSKEDCKNGYLLDGFPRTKAQIEAMEDNNISVDFVIEIKVPAESIIKRLSGRRVHLGSGRIYHVDNKPPKKDGFDDETGDPLVQRDDDKPETIKARLDVYEQQTKALTEIYKDKAQQGKVSYIQVNGDQDMAVVREYINSNLNGNPDML